MDNIKEATPEQHQTVRDAPAAPKDNRRLITIEIVGPNQFNIDCTPNIVPEALPIYLMQAADNIAEVLRPKRR